MPATQPTQMLVEIREVKDGVIHLKRGGLRRILVVSGVNFDLKSVEEQGIILGSFQNFLNTLDFSIQFFIHSRKVNIERHLAQVRARREKEENELLKMEIDDYMHFVSSFVAENPIITKAFFVVVPYDARGAKAKKGLLSIFKKSPSSAASKEESLDDRHALLQLEQRVDGVVAGLESIGLHAEFLNDEHITELFYNLYNPQLVEKKSPGAAGS